MSKKLLLSKHVYEEMRFHNKYSHFLIKGSKTDFIWIIQEKIIFIKKYLSEKRAWSWLDIGCGSAENIRRNILPKIKREDIYIGIDVSEKLLEKARENIPSGIFIQKPMGKLKFSSEIFDYISFFGSLHHDEFPQKTLKRISRFLKVGGYLFLREPSEEVMKKGYGLSPHEGGINPKELRSWLENLNFEIMEWHFLNTKIFHFIRKILNKIKLKNWEEIEFFWRVKVRFEFFLEKFLENNIFSYALGTDMFIIARKLK